MVSPTRKGKRIKNGKKKKVACNGTLQPKAQKKKDNVTNWLFFKKVGYVKIDGPKYVESFVKNDDLLNFLGLLLS